jgi:nitroreductase
MKSLDEIISSRRSIREYLDKPVEKEKIVKILDAARLAPSACNAQPWRFVVVDDKSLLKQLLDEGSGVVVPNKWAKSAPVMVVVCSDLDFFTHKLAEQIQGVHYHLIDIGIACEHLVLKAAEQELGTCYIGWFKGPNIKNLLKLPKSWKVECLITLGYPKTMPEPTKRKTLKDISSFNLM